MLPFEYSGCWDVTCRLRTSVTACQLSNTVQGFSICSDDCNQLISEFTKSFRLTCMRYNRSMTHVVPRMNFWRRSPIREMRYVSTCTGVTHAGITSSPRFASTSTSTNSTDSIQLYVCEHTNRKNNFEEYSILYATPIPKHHSNHMTSALPDQHHLHSTHPQEALHNVSAPLSPRRKNLHSDSTRN